MKNYKPTIIIRHRRENLKKCSLRGLESRDDLQFYIYPKDALPPLLGYFLLSFNGPLITPKDAPHGLILIDGTWRLSETIYRNTPALAHLPTRSLPTHLTTAYPRKQDDCAIPSRGLASIEALYAAYHLLSRPDPTLLNHYHWKEPFLKLNRDLTT